jgi:hypothetical protein
MKKLFLLAACYCLYVSVNAQSGSQGNQPDVSGLTGAVPQSAAFHRAQHDFSLIYPKVTGSYWEVTTDGGFVSQFREAGVVSQVHFSKNGRWVYRVTGYEGQWLPPAIKSEIEHCYEGYLITYVHEVEGNLKDLTYFVTIETMSKIKVIKIVGDDMEVWKDQDKL